MTNREKLLIALSLTAGSLGGATVGDVMAQNFERARNMQTKLTKAEASCMATCIAAKIPVSPAKVSQLCIQRSGNEFLASLDVEEALDFASVPDGETVCVKKVK
jgi:hypothetical protein